MSATPVSREMVALLERAATALGPPPRVRALHVPPPSAAGKDGEFCALELEDGSLGFSYVRLGDTRVRLRAGVETLAGREALDLAGDYRGQHGLRRMLGFAAVNALTRWFFDRAGWSPPFAADAIGGLDPRPGDHVGMVGLFPPLLKAVVGSGARLTVIELRADLAGVRDGWRVVLDPAELRSCSKVLSTSTVLLDETLDGLLAHCRQAERIAMIGPGAGCPPDPLFARSVTALGVPGSTTRTRHARRWSPASRGAGTRGSSCCRGATIPASRRCSSAAADRVVRR